MVDRIVWPHEQDSIFRLRALILFSSLFAGLILGSFALIAAVVLILKESVWGLAVVDICGLLLGLTLLFAHRIRFEIRASLTCVSCYVIGLGVILSVGPLSGGPAWLFAFAVLAGVLMGNYAALVAILMNVICLLIIGILISTGKFGAEFPFFNTPEAMIAAGVNFIVLNAITAISVSVLLKGLNESEKLYRLITENVADVIWTTKMDLELTYISPSIYEQLGYTSEEAMKKTINEFLLPESLEKIINLYENKLEQIKFGDDEAWEPVIFEAEQYCKDGTTIWTSIHARILQGSDKKPSHILGITRDITERRRTRQMIIQSEKMMSVGGLAAGMAHEINNPLAGMMQNAQVIRNRLTKELPINKKIAEEFGTSMNAIKGFMDKRDVLNQLESINEAGRRAAKIINNMLSFSRKNDRIKKEHELNDIIDNTINLARNDYDLKKKYDFKNIEIIRKYHSDIPKVPCEESKIQQVIFNLVKNATEAVNSDETKNRKPKLIFRLLKNQNMVRLEIEDNGPGMNSDTKKRIFEPFFTTKSVEEGTGLGLFVSYFIIVDDHGGTMEVDSKMGKGTKFIIKLPF